MSLWSYDIFEELKKYREVSEKNWKNRIFITFYIKQATQIV